MKPALQGSTFSECRYCVLGLILLRRAASPRRGCLLPRRLSALIPPPGAKDLGSPTGNYPPRHPGRAG